jgi:hypothetical protein
MRRNKLSTQLDMSDRNAFPTCGSAVGRTPWSRSGSLVPACYGVGLGAETAVPRSPLAIAPKCDTPMPDWLRFHKPLRSPQTTKCDTTRHYPTHPSIIGSVPQGSVSHPCASVSIRGWLVFLKHRCAPN